MATISAWAVGSLVFVTWLFPVAIIWPSFTMTTPKGPPRLLFMLSAEMRMASLMNSFSCFMFIFLDVLNIDYGVMVSLFGLKKIIEVASEDFVIFCGVGNISGLVKEVA